MNTFTTEPRDNESYFAGELFAIEGIEHTDEDPDYGCALEVYDVRQALFHAALNRIENKQEGTYQFDLVNIADFITKRALEDKNRALEAERHVDALTGCLSKQGFEQELSRILDHRRSNIGHPEQRIHENNGEFAVFFLDLNKFKTLNDTYGHQLVDRYLTQLGATLQETVRDTDIVGRFGGDEFYIAFRDVNVDDLEVLAQKIHDNTPLFTAGDSSEKVTFSIGVALPNGNDDTVETLIERADKAMFTNKHGYDQSDRPLYSVAE